MYKDLKKAGYEVYPVNPNTDEIFGDKCYPDLGELPKKPDVVDVVVPPEVTEEMVKTCVRLGVTKVWVHPDSESETAIKFCDDNYTDVVHGVCVMIERRSRT